MKKSFIYKQCKIDSDTCFDGGQQQKNKKIQETTINNKLSP